MGLILDRTVRRIESDGRPGPSEPLAAYRDTAAWVLLGDPGAGKTTAFEEESRSWEGAHFVSARDFLTFNPARHPEWRERTLLIDGLDEVRAGQADARTPFDAIRARLDQLGKPKFRLSCREADWLGNNDREHLKRVSPDGEIVVLRLDPLSDAQVRALASDLLRGSDPAAFFAAASDRGLEPLLGNPQNLELLAGVFSDSGQLPASRLETFEQASALLAQERNEEYWIGGDELLPVESLLKAAGRLSAVQLLSGAAGHCLSEQEKSADYIPISVHGKDRRADIWAVLRTPLFAAADEERRFRPAHAHLAAFLAARHLARLVEEGIPKNRILGLLVGQDGALPTPLRGLAAWLAASSQKLRRSLTKRDPAAVLIYGDVRGFTSAEKTFLLDSLGRDPSRLHESRWPSSAVAALASRDMEAELVARLTNADRSDAAQSLVEVIAEALAHGGATGALSDALLAVVEDPTYWPRVRTPALDAWIAGLADEPDRITRLRTVLDAIHESRIGDPDRTLMGTLLAKLYPDHLGPPEVWAYFRPASEFVIGRFFKFWLELRDSCPSRHLPAHLDYLADSIHRLRGGLDDSSLEAVPVGFLARALPACGSGLDADRLVRWLRVGLDEEGLLSAGDGKCAAAVQKIGKWLESHPDAQKNVIRFALRSEEFRRHDREHIPHFLGQLLYLSPLPEDIGSWHLDEAVAAETPDLVEAHLSEFLRALGERPVGVDMALARARHRLKARPEATDFLDDQLKSVLPEWRIEQAIRRRHIRSKSSQPNTRLLNEIQSRETELRDNQAPGRLLHWIARTYYGQVGFGEGRRDRLVRALGGDEVLVEAALGGVFNIFDRHDLPSAEEILRTRRRNRMSVFVLPTLMAVQQWGEAELLRLTTSQVRTVLACRLCFYGFSQWAGWYSVCVREHPKLVADVLIRFSRALLRTCKETFPDYYHFAHNAEFDKVAKLATDPLLRAFPIRATANQLDNLNELLWSGLQYMDGIAFRRLIEKKLESRNMTRAQRTRWLAAGLASDPGRFLPRLSEDVGDSEKRVRDLVSFFQPPDTVPGLSAKLDFEAVKFLIRKIGALFEPIWEEGILTVRTKAAICVRRCIHGLANSGDEAATDALQALAPDSQLAKWRSDLERARDTQRIVRRDANYRPPGPGQVTEALRDGLPAGAADLRELVVDRLKRIAKEARDTNANLWQQFWNEDAGKPTTPKYENTCRDALLALLRPRLPAGCDAQPEGQYAANRRADLRISCGEWNVPVEIKKTSHEDLWQAVRNQLLPRYTNDPATEGLGIYLVLWFGRDPKMRLSPKGKRPKTPKKLRKWLCAGLKPEERRRTAVLVMDVTPS